MGLFNFFKNKGKDTQKGLTLEECIVKMFASSGINPNRDENKFATEVEGKHCVFNVALTSMDGNRLLVYVPFPIPVDANVAFAANYEVKRISKCSTDELSGTNIYLTEKAYDIQRRMEAERKKQDRELTRGMSRREIEAVRKNLEKLLYNIAEP